MNEKIKVRISGRAQVTVSQDVYMRKEAYDRMIADLDGPEAGTAIECALCDYADMRCGDFEDFELDQFEVTP